jgi:hypothetical protein
MSQLSTYYTEATWSTDNYFSKKVTDNFFNSTPVTYMLKDNAEMVDGGESLELSSIFDDGDGEWFQEWGTYTNAHKEQLGAGRVNWKLYTVPVILSNMQLLKNSGSRTRRYNLAKLKNMVAAKTAARDFDVALWTLHASASADAIDSLDASIDSANPTLGAYAGITRAAAPGSTVWVSTEDGTNTTLSMNALQTNYGAASYGSERPNLLATTQANYNRIFDFYTPIQRVGSDLMGKAGFTSLIFNGAPVVVCHNIAAGYLYGLNMNHIDLAAHPEAFFSFEKYVVPSNQWVSIGRYFFMGNVRNHGPRYHFKMTAIAA